MKKIICFVIFIVPFYIISQENPFKNLKYDIVIAYEFKSEEGLGIKNCLIKDIEKINKKLTLTKNRVQKLENILTSKKDYGNTTMSCFDPHFAVVYYLNKKIVGTIDICLNCNYLISSKEIPSTRLKFIKISEDYSYPANGFSKNTRKEIYDYIKSLRFTKYLKPLTSYLDE